MNYSNVFGYTTTDLVPFVWGLHIKGTSSLTLFIRIEDSGNQYTYIINILGIYAHIAPRS
jgi:hypothetical protein